MKPVRIPGKVFLMGEYSVIDGGKAILVATQPGFEYSRVEGESISIHPESPTGKFFEETSQSVPLRMINAGLGAGFGTSTAELIAAVKYQHGKFPKTRDFLGWYQKQFPRASGADLAIQLEALHQGHDYFEIAEKGIISPIQARHQQPILMFQAPLSEKVPTHENIKNARAEIPVDVANSFVDRLRHCIESESSDDWKVLTEWALWLSRLGLESDFAKKARSQLMRVSGILGAKGCGAGLNDVFVVAIDPQSEAKTQLFAAAEELGLKFIGSLEERAWTE